MKKFITLLTIVMVAILVAACATTKNAPTQAQTYEVEEIEVSGFGVGKSEDENIARHQGMTVALGDLSMKLQANVRTASSQYEKQTGTYNKVLFESLMEVVSENNLKGVTYKGDRAPASYKKGVYEYRIEARVNQTILRKTVDGILEELDATESERAAYRREMFGES